LENLTNAKLEAEAGLESAKETIQKLHNENLRLKEQIQLLENQ